MTAEKTTPVLVRLSPEQLAAVDDWRRLQEEIPSRPEAIRRLIERGLQAEDDGPTAPR